MSRRTAQSGYKRSSWFSVVFWSLSLIAVTVYSGWRFGWIPLGDGRDLVRDYLPLKNSVAGTSKEAQNPADLFEAPATDLTSNSTENRAFDFGTQSEPEVEMASVNGANSAPATSFLGHSRPRELNLREINQEARPVPLSQERAGLGTSQSLPVARDNQHSILQAGNQERSSTPSYSVRTANVPAASDQSAFSPSENTAPNLGEIDHLLEANEYLKAHRLMSGLYWKHPEWRSALQSRIDLTARSIYFARQPHYLKPYEVQPGDQLRNIASKYNVTWEYLARLNQLDPQKMRVDQKLKVLKGPFAAIVDLSEFELIIHAYGYYVKKYSVGIGKDDSTPLGTFHVQNKLKDPVYYGPEGLVIQNDDPENPLGEFWIDIGDGYGLHGTIDPDSIGKAESKGCIRMRSADIEEVYQFLVEGSEVTIRR
ncbi:MAG: L,D-transpeptidase family protein [Planctomycetaceae bacterium]|nr:L,D-transpeptidase family protein [Planctomycetaceae bacterium]